MKFNFEFSKCSSYLNSWKPVIGYETEEIKNDFNLDESDLAIVKDHSIPAGSKWQQYLDYTFIRLFNVELKGETLYVLSVAQVKQDDKTERFYPETYIDVFDNEGMNHLQKMSAEKLVNNINKQLGKNFISLEKDTIITDFVKQKFYTYSNNKKHERKQQEWYYLELFFIINTLNKWDPNSNSNKQQIISVATLCTMQDDFTRFDKIGIFDPQKLSLKGTIPSYGTIELIEPDKDNSGKILTVKVVSESQIRQEKFFYDAKNLLSRENFGIVFVTLAFFLGIFFLGIPIFNKFFFLPIHHSF